jgi:hypothetical protein
MAQGLTTHILKRQLLIATVLTIAALGFRLFLVSHLTNDDDDDGRFYSQIARNLLDDHGYSGEEEEPFVPTYVRVPGYPLFLAGAYRVFGRDNDRAVRIIQVLLDTITCLLVGILAFQWSPFHWNRQKRWRAFLIAMAFAAVCPFTTIYVTTILTETWALFLVTAFVLISTFALKSEGKRKWLWFFAGATGGLATMFRPDCAFFSGAVGLLVLSEGLLRSFRTRRAEPEPNDRKGLNPPIVNTLLTCGALSVGFVIALTPWTIRNARVFGVFQPVAPIYANMPDEFAPVGYISWLRTWVNDGRYVGPIEDALNLYPILIERIPDSAFDSSEERERVRTLLDLYNNPIKQDPQSTDSDEGDFSDEPTLKMTPEIDERFAEIARERIARHPLKYGLVLPVERAFSMWFDTHTQYYPFQGELFPLSDIDTDAHQQYWLLSFAGLTWMYTIAGAMGAFLMLSTSSSRRWGILVIMLILPRLAFLAFQEHPESRYTVEFFPFCIAAGAIALSSLKGSTGKIGLALKRLAVPLKRAPEA